MTCFVVCIKYRTVYYIRYFFTGSLGRCKWLPEGPDVRRWRLTGLKKTKVRCVSAVTGQARSRAEGPAWRVRHNETGQRKRPRTGRDGGTGAPKKHRRAAHRMMPSARCCGSSSLRIAWESHVYLRGHRRSNRRLWAGTRALPQRLFGIHAARALLSGPGGNPEQAGGTLEWWVTEPGHFDEAGALGK